MPKVLTPQEVKEFTKAYHRLVHFSEELSRLYSLCGQTESYSDIYNQWLREGGFILAQHHFDWSRFLDTVEYDRVFGLYYEDLPFALHNWILEHVTEAARGMSSAFDNNVESAWKLPTGIRSALDLDQLVVRLVAARLQAREELKKIWEYHFCVD